jgi:hypothetical protein
VSVTSGGEADVGIVVLLAQAVTNESSDAPAKVAGRLTSLHPDLTHF